MHNLFKAVKTYRSLDRQHKGYFPYSLYFIHFDPIADNVSRWRFGGANLMFQGTINQSMESRNYCPLDRFYAFAQELKAKELKTLSWLALPLDRDIVSGFDFDLYFKKLGTGEQHPLEQVELLGKFEGFLKKNDIKSVEVVKEPGAPFINFTLPYCEVITRGLGDLR